MNKPLLFTVLLIFVKLSLVAQQDPLWNTDFEKAMAVSHTEHKPVMIYFSGSDWCKPCIQLSRNVLETEHFKTFATEHVVLLNVDFPRLKKNRTEDALVRQNDQLAELYNPNGIFPLLVIIDEAQHVIREMTYHQETDLEFIEKLSQHLGF